MEITVKRLILFMILGLFSTQCKKDKPGSKDPGTLVTPIDTLKPRSYYPVFPGSYWVYLNGKGDSIKQHASLTYIKHCYDPGFVDTVFVPFLDGNAIYQYDVISWFLPVFNGNRGAARTPFFSESKGASFKLGGWDSRYQDHRPTATIKDKELINGDSVLTLIIRYDYRPNVITERYTKNVGLTRRFEIDTIKKDTISQLRLIKFFINK